MSKPKPQTGTGQFKCGKCGAPFTKAHGLAIHILRAHKRTWGKTATPKAQKSATVATLLTCNACGRKDFKKYQALSAHRRFCKGRGVATLPKPSVVVPGRPAPIRPISPIQVSEPTVLPVNGNQIDRLKAVAQQKRREADEIERLIASFEVSAQRYLIATK